MTPLLGTKYSSAPVGDKSGGDRRAARSLLPCALRRGYGAAWAAWATRAVASLFTIVHHCSLLFGIVRHCSAKNITPEPVSPLRPHRQQACKVFTKHETRNTVSPFLQRLQGEQPQARPTGFHETRDTKHGFFSPWVRKGRTIRNPRPDRRARRPVASFLCVVVRHGAAMVRHGRPPSPAPATRPVGFSRIRKHETRNTVFPVPAAIPRRATPSPANRFSRITKHETRITAFFLPRNTNHETRLLSFPTHHFPPFPTISRHFPAIFGPPHPPQPIKGPPAVHRSGWDSRRAPCVGNPTKMHKIPDPTGKCAKHSVRRGPAAANAE